MDAVIIPAKTTVHINGIPVRLAVDTIVETGSMWLLTGYHYASFPETPKVDIAALLPPQETCPTCDGRGYMIGGDGDAVVTDCPTCHAAR
jgi:hypothetical protein